MKKPIFLAVLVTVLAAAPARAQYEHPVHFNLGGGFTTPLSATSDRFGAGPGFNIGVIVETGKLFALQAEYSFDNLSGQDLRIPLLPAPLDGTVSEALLESRHDMHSVTFNGIMHMPGTSRFRPYAVGGGGMHYRTVSLRTPDVGFVSWCDPYLYLCYPTLVETDRIIGKRASWDPGVNLGGGININLGETSSFYVEMRWRYLWGNAFTGADGVTRRANGQYIPLTFGLRL